MEIGFPRHIYVTETPENRVTGTFLHRKSKNCLRLLRIF